jgi:hypothetical protein
MESEIIRPFKKMKFHDSIFLKGQSIVVNEVVKSKIQKRRFTEGNHIVILPISKKLRLPLTAPSIPYKYGNMESMVFSCDPRNFAATDIQRIFRGWSFRKKLNVILS